MPGKLAEIDVRGRVRREEALHVFYEILSRKARGEPHMQIFRGPPQGRNGG